MGKTDKEIKMGLEHEIFAFNVESLQELKVLEQLSGITGKKIRFALRINPNVDAGTHEYITTGKRDNKFGITLEELNLAIPLIKSLEHAEVYRDSLSYRFSNNGSFKIQGTCRSVQ